MADNLFTVVANDLHVGFLLAASCALFDAVHLVGMDAAIQLCRAMGAVALLPAGRLDEPERQDPLAEISLVQVLAKDGFADLL